MTAKGAAGAGRSGGAEGAERVEGTDGVVLAFDVGGTWLRAARVEGGALVGEPRRQPTPVGDGTALIEQLCELTRELSRQGPPPRALGLALAGLQDVRAGVCVASPNAGFAGLKLRALLEGRTGLPLTLINDLNAAALAEARAARCDDLAAIFLGTGVGTGLVCGGQVLQGARGMGGECGHLAYRPDGPPCDLGCRGCFESYLGGLALGRRAQAAGVASDAAGLLAAWRAGDPRALPLVSEARDAYRALVRLLVSAFDPARVVLGGGLGRAWPELLEDGRRALTERPLAGVVRDVVLEPARLDGDAGLLGAALAVDL